MDGLTAEGVMHTYDSLASRGVVPNRDELYRKSPEVAPELEGLIGGVPLAPSASGRCARMNQ